jgi:beta-lactam-binding protein with PASTA domain
MKKIADVFRQGSLLALLINMAAAVSLLLLVGVIYFYIYLPGQTNHGETITVPDVRGMNISELEEFLASFDLRLEVNDSAYTEDQPPLTVTRQFPAPGALVKENRKVFVSINRVTPPTVPMPDLVDGSRMNAELILKSNELRTGRIILEPSPMLNLVREMRYLGKPIAPGTRIPKGAYIDLVVGDGRGPADFTIGNLVGDTYERALFKLSGWSLHLGEVHIPPDADTTGQETIVFKQQPLPGDSVRVGDPVTLWLAPKGYRPKADDEAINDP